MTLDTLGLNLIGFMKRICSGTIMTLKTLGLNLTRFIQCICSA